MPQLFISRNHRRHETPQTKKHTGARWKCEREKTGDTTVPKENGAKTQKLNKKPEY